MLREYKEGAIKQQAISISRAEVRLRIAFSVESLNGQVRYFNDAKSSAGGNWLLIIHKVIGDWLNAMPKRPKVESSSLADKKMRAWGRARKNPLRQSNERYSISERNIIFTERIPQQSAKVTPSLYRAAGSFLQLHRISENTYVTTAR